MYAALRRLPPYNLQSCSIQKDMYTCSSKSSPVNINMPHPFNQTYITPLRASNYIRLQMENLWLFPFCNKRAWLWPNCIAIVIQPFASLYPHGIYTRYVARVKYMPLFFCYIVLRVAKIVLRVTNIVLPGRLCRHLAELGNEISLGLIPSSLSF